MLRSSIGQWLVDFDPWLADYAFVSLALIHERRLGEQSALAPWVRSSLLPERPDVPLLWSAEQQEELKCSTTASNPNPNPNPDPNPNPNPDPDPNPDPGPNPNPDLGEGALQPGQARGLAEEAVGTRLGPLVDAVRVGGE